MNDYALPEMLRYLDRTQATLLASIDHGSLNAFPPEGGWSQAQVIVHLTRTEKYLYPLFTIVPLVIRSQRVLDAVNYLNIWLCRITGMKFESRGDQPEGLQGLTPQFRGRFLAPAFLKPRRRIYDWKALIANRTRTRQRTINALQRVNWEHFTTLRFSHPIFGSFTLAEFVLFLGKHEEWHTEQLTRIQSARTPLTTND